MDEAAGTVAADAAGGNPGTLGGGVTRVAGLTGAGALGFNNTAAAWVNAGTGASLAVTGGIGIEAVIRSTWDGTGTDVIFSRNNVSAPGALAAWYGFDESATGTAAAVDGAGGAAGSFSGTAVRTAGANGSTGAVRCNNAGVDGVNIGSGLAFSGSLTIAAWIRPGWSGNTGDYDEIFRKEDGGNRILFSFQRDNNNGSASPPVAAGPVLSLGLNTGGYRELDMPLDGVSGRPTLAQLKDGNWHHVAAVYDGATGVKAIYVDGTMRHSVVHSGNVVTGGGAAGMIGNTTGGGEAFTGEIDDFAMFRTALTAAQVASLAGLGATPGTVLPGVVPPARVLLALQNDGNNGSADPPVPAGPVLSFGLNTAGVYRELDMPLDGVDGRPTLARVTDGAAHHVAVGYDAATGLQRVYFDGVLSYEAVRSGMVSAAGAAPVTIGNLGPAGTGAFSGVIDEVAFWNRALTGEEAGRHWARVREGLDYFAPVGTGSAPPALRIEETGAAGGFFVELRNAGGVALDLSGYEVVTNAGGVYVLGAQSLAPGARLVVTAAELGFGVADGVKVFVRTPGGAQVVDAVEVGATGQGRTAGGDWAATASATPGEENVFVIPDDVVISEIMYRPRPRPGRAAEERETVLVERTATWRYVDDGSDPGAGWVQAGFDDGGWATGAGMFGSAAVAGAYAAAVTADGPLGWWRMDESGTVMNDASGNGRNGTATTGVVRGSDALVADGAGSRAITLSGANRVTVPGFEKIGAAGYSVEYWVKVMTPPSGFLNLVGDGDGVDFFLMNYLTPGMAVRPHYGFGNTPVSLDSVGTLSAGQVYHVVTTWGTAAAAGNAVIYVNGVADVSGTVTRNLPAAGTTGNNMVFIGYDNREPASGVVVMDEVALYNYPLSAARVAAHYRAGARPGVVGTTVATGAGVHRFRKEFEFGGEPAAARLFLNLAVDDGAEVYLNGVEVARENELLVERGSAAFGGLVEIPAGALRKGSNVLAVAVRQGLVDPDVFMGLELRVRETLAAAVPYAESGNTWLELHNRGGAAVDLSGWRLADGVGFDFAAGTVLAAGGRLVVANDPGAFAVEYPGVPVLGPLRGSFSRGGERLVLRDGVGNVADEVSYGDDAPWPSAADGGGASLEVRDVRGDNGVAEAWAASDESGKGEWKSYSYRAVAEADGGPVNWNEFQLGLMDAGEVLVDDVRVTSQPGTGGAAEVVSGGDFSGGAAGWRMLGTHRGSGVVAEPGNPGNGVLRVVSSGGTDVLHNHIEVTLAGNVPVVDGREYEISFRARVVSGSNLLNTRLYWNRCARTTRLEVRGGGGTPGMENSRAVLNAGPVFRGMRHEPAVPAVSQGCEVSVGAADPDGVAGVVLRYAVGGGAWVTVPMGLSEGRWVAVLPGQSAGVVVQYYVEASDGAGAVAFWPAEGAASRVLVQWQDGQANAGLGHNVRLIMTAADRARLFAPTELMADDWLGCTMVYDEREVFAGCRIRLKGSEHGRSDAGRQSYHVAFPAGRLFRGVHDSVLLDRSGGWRFGRTSGQDEILVKHLVTRAGGVSSLYDDVVRVIAPVPGHTGPALLQMARYGGDYLESMYRDGGDGKLYKMEIAYHSSATDNGQATGLKTAQEGAISNIDFGDRGADPERYRWFFRQENRGMDDDAAAMMAVTRAFGLSGAAFDAAIDPLIDNDEWMRAMALESLCGIADIFSRDNGHNANFYRRPKDGKMLLLPWDWDFAFVQSPTAPLIGSRGIAKLMQRPHNLRRFYGHLEELMGGAFSAARMSRWTDHYDNFTPGQDFSSILTWMEQRRAYVAGQIPAAAGWAVTEAPADGVMAGGAVGFAGTAPWSHQSVRFEVGGVRVAEARFTGLGEWVATVPLVLGVNVVSLRVYDVRGVLIPSASREFTVVGSEAGGFEDGDGDGLPDVWEGQTGLDAVAGAGAGADSDGDGVSDYAEYLQGSLPLNGSSALRPVVKSAGDGRVVLAFTAVAGRTYRVQVASDPGAGEWVAGPVIGPFAADREVEETVVVPGGVPRIFVRLAVP
jgi:hypothetical protein